MFVPGMLVGNIKQGQSENGRWSDSTPNGKLFNRREVSEVSKVLEATGREATTANFHAVTASILQSKV